jgi:hypothetical protein
MRRSLRVCKRVFLLFALILVLFGGRNMCGTLGRVEYMTRKETMLEGCF